MPIEPNPAGPAAQDDLYKPAALECGAPLARLAIAYEAHAEQQRDLLQEIHFAL